MATDVPVGHIPVMVSEVLDDLRACDQGIYVDGTFGQGGYSEAILQNTGTKVFGIDRDPSAINFGNNLSRKYSGRLTVIHGRFGDLKNLLEMAGVSCVDGVVFDLGVSSVQLEEPQRGFSFRLNGPLDMRMGPDGTTAADVVNQSSEQELSSIIQMLGEERQARAIARAIVQSRAEKPILTTAQLASIVRRIVKKTKPGVDPATRTFMALRIRVNDELGELERGLCAAEDILRPGGRLVVVSFHSLEDRIVKEFFHSRSGKLGGRSRHLPELSTDPPTPSFRLFRKGVIKPQASETSINPRSRSARLRTAERTDAMPWLQQRRAGSYGASRITGA